MIIPERNLELEVKDYSNDTKVYLRRSLPHGVMDTEELQSGKRIFKPGDSLIIERTGKNEVSREFLLLEIGGLAEPVFINAFKDRNGSLVMAEGMVLRDGVLIDSRGQRLIAIASGPVSFTTSAFAHSFSAD